MLSEVLDLINKGRGALHLPTLAQLPKGRLGSCFECVVARAFGAGAGDRWITFEGSVETYKPLADAWGTCIEEDEPGRVSVHLPLVLINFISKFDCVHYPELVEYTNLNITRFAENWHWCLDNRRYSPPFQTREEAQANADALFR